MPEEKRVSAEISRFSSPSVKTACAAFAFGASCSIKSRRQTARKLQKEGVNFLFQNNIVEIKGNNKVEKLELIKTKLVKKDGENRLSPVNIEGSNYEIDTDYVVMALGSNVSEEVLELGLTLNKWGNIIINEKFQTSETKIFAGGDLAGCKGTVAWAARSGRDAAESIKEFLK